MPTANDQATIDETRKTLAVVAVLNYWKAGAMARAVGSASSPSPPPLIFLRGPELLVVHVTSTDATRKQITPIVGEWFADMAEHHNAETLWVCPATINEGLARLIREPAG